MRLSKSAISLLIASLLCGADSLTLGSEITVDKEGLRERETLWCVRDDRDVQAREKYLDGELDREFPESREWECEFRDLDSRDWDLYDRAPADLDRDSRDRVSLVHDLCDRDSLIRDICDRECRDLEFREEHPDPERDRPYSFVRLQSIFSPRVLRLL